MVVDVEGIHENRVDYGVSNPTVEGEKPAFYG
jgi:hypothetical protein